MRAIASAIAVFCVIVSEPAGTEQTYGGIEISFAILLSRNPKCAERLCNLADSVVKARGEMNLRGGHIKVTVGSDTQRVWPLQSRILRHHLLLFTGEIYLHDRALF